MATKKFVFDPEDQIIPNEKLAAELCGVSVSTYRRNKARGIGPKQIRISDRTERTTPRLIREWRQSRTLEARS
jgi:hypothetical protein